MATATKSFEFSNQEDNIANGVNVNFDDVLKYINDRNDGTATWDFVYAQTTSTAAAPVMKLDQKDIDDSFIDFIGTSDSDGSKSISSDTTEDSAKFGAIRIEINGATKWIRIYDDES